MGATLPLAEWPDPRQWRLVTYAAVVPSTVVIEGRAETPGSPEVFVLTVDATHPGTMPPGADASREVLCIRVAWARQIADAFQADLEPPGA